MLHKPDAKVGLKIALRLLLKVRKSESINESLKEIVALDLAKSAAIATFPTEAERVVDLYDEPPPIWYPDSPPIMNKQPCDYEENGIKTWRVGVETPMLANELNPSN
jgi:hypothetical protein